MCGWVEYKWYNHFMKSFVKLKPHITYGPANLLSGSYLTEMPAKAPEDVHRNACGSIRTGNSGTPAMT